MARGIDLNKVLIDGEKAGLSCCLNFMFGLPGETDEDAEENIEFIRRHRNRITTVNPSPSFCSLMPGSPAGDCPEKFGIDYTSGELYWEADAGKNNYRVRMERFERFCRAALDLGLTSTYPHPQLLNRYELLANYYLAIGDEINAQHYLKLSLEEEEYNHHLLTLYLELFQKHRGEKEVEKEKIRIEQAVKKTAS
jgi:radical SAM superfamily enzyme YgiQ (UPF0313 family)